MLVLGYWHFINKLSVFLSMFIKKKSWWIYNFMQTENHNKLNLSSLPVCTTIYLKITNWIFHLEIQVWFQSTWNISNTMQNLIVDICYDILSTHILVCFCLNALYSIFFISYIIKNLWIDLIELFQGDWRFSNKADPNGLVSGHAYTITAVRKVSLHHSTFGFWWRVVLLTIRPHLLIFYIYKKKKTNNN